MRLITISGIILTVFALLLANVFVFTNGVQGMGPFGF
jgi:hypothetical protein